MSVLPNRDRRAERREATRREILDAAWEIARRDGLSAVTLREVAGRIGMRSPSLYSHFDSKNAIYDAMFAQSWGELCAVFDAIEPLPAAHRGALLVVAEAFFDFAAADLARYQLMNQRTIPDFRPSEEAYAQSLAVYERMRAALRGDVRAMAAHALGMVEMAASIRENNRQLKLARRRGEVFIDALTALQIEERAGMTPAQITARFAARAPKAARGRRRAPAFIRR